MSLLATGRALSHHEALYTAGTFLLYVYSKLLELVLGKCAQRRDVLEASHGSRMALKVKRDFIRYKFTMGRLINNGKTLRRELSTLQRSALMNRGGPGEHMVARATHKVHLTFSTPPSHLHVEQSEWLTSRRESPRLCDR